MEGEWRLDQHRPDGRRLKILFLYDPQSVHINTVRDHLASFSRYSAHTVRYCPAVNGARLRVSLDLFDVVVVHYSVRLAFRGRLALAFAYALAAFQGLKALFIQDEYDNTWTATDAINRLGIRVVFTCVPPRHVRRIYSRVGDGVEFFPVLTGYVPLDLDQQHGTPPLRERRLVVGYRGRELPFRYGRLAREKLLIGQRMREACERQGIPHDIEWTDDKRIYGPDWLRFLADCRATLASESGCNIFDYDGALKLQIEEALDADPSLTFEQVHARYLASQETDAIMNQISPRVFEAVAMRTGLVLFEGDYSGVIRPHEHFIPLKKDFSNVDEVLARVKDDACLAPMIDRAYRSVIGSGEFTYEKFVRQVDSILEARTPREHGGRASARGCGVVSRQCHNAAGAGLHGEGVFDSPVGPPHAPPQPAWRRRLRLVPTAARLLLSDGMCRATLARAALGNWPLRLRWQRLVRDLLNVALLRRVSLYRGPDPLAFRLCCVARRGNVLVLSVPVGPLGDAGADEAADWAAVEATLRAGAPARIVWDHTQVAEDVRYPLGQADQGCVLLSANCRYDFTALAALARLDARRVVALLRHALAADGGPGPAAPTHAGAHCDNWASGALHGPHLRSDASHPKEERSTHVRPGRRP
jgi:hypothetical protein